MASRKRPLGTSLSAILEKEAPLDPSLGPINRRRARLDKQQTVKDDQGRKRFHGAFTGGSISGQYYDTIGTIQGFKPKQFVSHRDQERKDGPRSSAFSHRPEDYMDEDDFGEFGIAPKKLRINNQFNSRSTALIESTNSIGERILRRIDLETCNRNPGNIRRKNPDPLKARAEAYNMFEKRLEDNSIKFYHGLGYKTLNHGMDSIVTGDKDGNSSRTNPLTAVLKDGKRLKISGQAFGTGVGHKETDDYDIDDAYQVNEVEFNHKKPTSTSIDEKNKYTGKWLASTSDEIDVDCLSGFVRSSQDEHDQPFDLILRRYPNPQIEDGWHTPEEPSMTPDSSPPRLKDQDSESRSGGLIRDEGSLRKKFLSGTESLDASDDIINQRIGLVHYSDLKISSDLQAKSIAARQNTVNESYNPSPSVTRTKFEWHPVSLLCKRFNVPNPFPNSYHVGVKTTDTLTDGQQSRPKISSVPILSGVASHPSDCFAKTRASYELKQSIFDIASEYETEDDEDSDRIIHPVYLRNVEDNPDPDSDNQETNVMQLIENMRSSNGNNNKGVQISESDGEDVAIVPILVPEPEVITIDSSSDSSYSSQKLVLIRDESTRNSGSDSDSYGPPLPPK